MKCAECGASCAPHIYSGCPQDPTVGYLINCEPETCQCRQGELMGPTYYIGGTVAGVGRKVDFCSADCMLQYHQREATR